MVSHAIVLMVRSVIMTAPSLDATEGLGLLSRKVRLSAVKLRGSLERVRFGLASGDGPLSQLNEGEADGFWVESPEGKAKDDDECDINEKPPHLFRRPLRDIEAGGLDQFACLPEGSRIGVSHDIP